MSRSKLILQASVAEILAKLEEGNDKKLREGLEESPQRVAGYLLQMTDGYELESQLPYILKTFTDGAKSYNEMVFEGGISFFSLCEHHLAPFFGVVHIGYIPNGKIVGLSKLPRLVDVYAHRLQVQERLTEQIASTLFTVLSPIGVGVVVRARHLCMESRGIRRVGVTTTTSTLLGGMKEGSARAEFLSFVSTAEMRSPTI